MMARHLLFAVALQRHLLAFCSKYIHRQGFKRLGLSFHKHIFSHFPTFYGRLAGFQNSFKIEQRKEELTRALHIFSPFNNSDAICDPSVSFPGFSSLALHVSFVMQPLFAHFTRLVPSLYLVYEVMKGD